MGKAGWINFHGRDKKNVFLGNSEQISTRDLLTVRSSRPKEVSSSVHVTGQPRVWFWTECFSFTAEESGSWKVRCHKSASWTSSLQSLARDGTMTVFVPPEWEEVIQTHLDAGCLTDQRILKGLRHGNQSRFFFLQLQLCLKQEQRQRTLSFWRTVWDPTIKKNIETRTSCQSDDPKLDGWTVVQLTVLVSIAERRC